MPMTGGEHTASHNLERELLLASTPMDVPHGPADLVPPESLPIQWELGGCPTTKGLSLQNQDCLSSLENSDMGS